MRLNPRWQLIFFIEFKNSSASPFNLDGYVIQKIGATTEETIISSVQIPANGYYVFDNTVLGFSIFDEDLVVIYAPGKASIVDARHVKNTLRGLYPDGTGDYLRLSSATSGTANLLTLNSSIVINEIMYNASDSAGVDWIELYNKSAQPVDVSGWKFSDGVDLTIAAGTSIAAGGVCCNY